MPQSESLSAFTDAPPTRIPIETRETSGRYLLRKETQSDARAVGDAIWQNLDRLAQWMPWADSNSALEATQHVRIADSAKRWDTGEEFDYVLMDTETGVLLGKCGLHRRVGPRAIELGYWLTRDAVGHGLMTAAARALTAAALDMTEISHVEIHCDAANSRSSAIPERLGYRLDRIDTHPVTTPAQTGRQMVWIYPI